MNSVWVRRRWHDFRMGHGTYLIFMMAFAQFVLIVHRMLIERIAWLNDILGDLWMFAALFVLLYVPVAVFVGAWHRKTQTKVDNDMIMLQQPLFAKILRTMMDIQAGRATPEEVDAMRALLKSIEDKRV